MLAHSRRKQGYLGLSKSLTAQKCLQIKQRQARWVPKPINDENAIFSQQPANKKPMRKAGQAAIVSIDIFDLETVFKPSVKRNQYSNRTSYLFSQDQSERKWRSSSKKPSISQTPKNDNVRYCFKSASKHKGNSSSIDLSWTENASPSTPLKESRLNKSRLQFCEERKIFQSKKRVGLFNCSSIELK